MGSLPNKELTKKHSNCAVVGNHGSLLEARLGEWGVVQKARDLADAYEVAAVESLTPLQHPSVKGLLRRVVGKIFGEGDLIEGYCSEFEALNRARQEEAPKTTA